MVMGISYVHRESRLWLNQHLCFAALVMRQVPKDDNVRVESRGVGFAEVSGSSQRLKFRVQMQGMRWAEITTVSGGWIG